MAWIFWVGPGMIITIVVLIGLTVWHKWWTRESFLRHLTPFTGLFFAGLGLYFAADALNAEVANSSEQAIAGVTANILAVTALVCLVWWVRTCIKAWRPKDDHPFGL